MGLLELFELVCGIGELLDAIGMVGKAVARVGRWIDAR